MLSTEDSKCINMQHVPCFFLLSTEDSNAAVLQILNAPLLLYIAFNNKSTFCKYVLMPIESSMKCTYNSKQWNTLYKFATNNYYREFVHFGHNVIVLCLLKVESNNWNFGILLSMFCHCVYWMKQCEQNSKLLSFLLSSVEKVQIARIIILQQEFSLQCANFMLSVEDSNALLLLC